MVSAEERLLRSVQNKMRKRPKNMLLRHVSCLGTIFFFPLWDPMCHIYLIGLARLCSCCICHIVLAVHSEELSWKCISQFQPNGCHFACPRAVMSFLPSSSHLMSPCVQEMVPLVLLKKKKKKEKAAVYEPIVL